MKPIVVLGGSGFVGRHVVSQLAAQGLQVLVPSRRRERAKHLILLPTVDVVDADIHDEQTLRDLCADAAAVINLVGILNEVRSDSFALAHVELARKLVVACRANGVSRVIHMSALNARADGPSAYLRSKGEAARIVVESGLAWTIFEPSVIFGREDRFLNLFARIQRWVPVLYLGGANARFQPVFVEDVARAFVHCVFDDATIGQHYRLCGPKVYTLRELVRYAGELSGHPRPIMPLPPGLAALQAAVLECLPGKLMSRDNLASMQVDSVCDCPFPVAFGFAPTTLESIAPKYLARAASRDYYANYRGQHR
jgi:NADH dehydrogenase